MARVTMEVVWFTTLCLISTSFYLTNAKDGRVVKPPPTRFTCQGRASGYYADMDTGCQVYHMCDGLGRQFSYSCPNTTLFQQRMLVCDHWYMVNCSKSESDYDANLLIGQRDKPFVSDEDMRTRTPRPDVLSVPPNSNYYDGLKEAETKFPIHPGNSIVGIADSISDDYNDLDSAKQSFRPPTSWSTRIGTFANKGVASTRDRDSVTEASHGLEPTFIPTPNDGDNVRKFHVPPPARELNPPLRPVTAAETDGDGFNFNIKAQEGNEDPIFNFIKRFDPNNPDSHKTTMTKTEIIDINEQLPSGQVSSEEERVPRKNKNFANTFNKLQIDKKKSIVESTRFNSVNDKAKTTAQGTGSGDTSQIPVPDVHLLPPKTEYSQLPSTTMGPPIYYEWKWAVPAFDLEPPKESNATNSTGAPRKRTVPGRRPFSDVARSTTTLATPTPQNTEYNISSYFVPDYVFPLDKQHPGYEDEEAETSFRVRISRPGRASYGENDECPQCHPAYLKPGTCEPCIVRR